MRNLRDLLSGLRAPRGGEVYYKVLVEDDLMSSNTDCVAGKWNRIGEFRVPAQQAYTWGYGTPKEPDNQGYVYAYLRDPAGNEVKGKIRLVVTDANDARTRVVFEERSDVLHGSMTDRTQMKPLPNTGVEALEDDKLAIEFQPDTNGTVSYTQTILVLPTTNRRFSRF